MVAWINCSGRRQSPAGSVFQTRIRYRENSSRARQELRAWDIFIGISTRAGPEIAFALYGDQGHADTVVATLNLTVPVYRASIEEWCGRGVAEESFDPVEGVEIEFVAGASDGGQDLLSLASGIAAVAAGEFAGDDVGAKFGFRFVVRRRDHVGALEVPEDLIAVFDQKFLQTCIAFMPNACIQ